MKYFCFFCGIFFMPYVMAAGDLFSLPDTEPKKSTYVEKLRFFSKRCRIMKPGNFKEGEGILNLFEDVKIPVMETKMKASPVAGVINWTAKTPEGQEIRLNLMKKTLKVADLNSNEIFGVIRDGEEILIPMGKFPYNGETYVIESTSDIGYNALICQQDESKYYPINHEDGTPDKYRDRKEAYENFLKTLNADKEER